MKNEINKTAIKRTPWPTKDAMAQIYTHKLWGDNRSDFYSGDGSHHPEIVIPYLEALTSFLTSFENPLVICDLGCGDFNIGKELVKYSKKYVAVDIVSELIERNRQKFNDENLEFHCLDIAVHDLPSGDCAIIKQVLQHLSNAEIQSILGKLAAFKYVILTEHIPEGEFIPNKDIISGQGTRLKKKSGLNLSVAPFNFKFQLEKQISSVVLSHGKGVILTTVYELF